MRIEVCANHCGSCWKCRIEEDGIFPLEILNMNTDVAVGRDVVIWQKL
jgi:hypothetical protein